MLDHLSGQIGGQRFALRPALNVRGDLDHLGDLYYRLFSFVEQPTLMIVALTARAKAFGTG
jgi:hypothetical protein